MSIVTCWDPGQGGSEQIASILATVTGLNYVLRLLLLHDGEGNSGVEDAFEAMEKYYGDSMLAVSDQGMEAILRLSHSQRLTRENISNYTRPILRGRLDLVEGRFTSGKNEGSLGMSEHDLMSVLRVAKQYYDLVFMHTNEVSLMAKPELIHESDVIVVTLKQNMRQLESFFTSEEIATVLQDKPYGIVIHHYDASSQCTVQNIKRKFGCKVPVYGIPYYTELHDAWNGRDIVPFLQRGQFLSGKGKGRARLLQSLRDMSKGILQLTGREETLIANKGGA